MKGVEMGIINIEMFQVFPSVWHIKVGVDSNSIKLKQCMKASFPKHLEQQNLKRGFETTEHIHQLYR